jgi:phosphatidylinositol-3-phosphatase
MVLLLSSYLAVLSACGGAAGSSSSTPLPSPVPPPVLPPTSAPPAGPTGMPLYSHVVLVLEENHSYEQVIGNAAMPFLNQLAGNNSLATNTSPTRTPQFRTTS